MANANINIKVGYTLDKSKWNEIDQALRSLSAEAAKIGNESNTGLQKAAQSARELSNILNNSFNKDLGTVNVTRFAQQIAKSNIDIGNLKTQLTAIGPAGANAFNAISSSILGTSAQIKQTSAFLDRMATTFKNTIRYGISSSIWNNFANSFQKAYDYSKDLNESLNNIRIVTKQSTDQMNQFAVTANEAAKRLGTSTLDYTNAALIYYQQGLSDQEAQARAEVTLKAANVTGQSAAEVSEQLTAVWNGYQVSAEESEKYIDKLALVAANSASNLEELSTGMSKVAAAANSMGVDIDQLNAQLSTIISVTRQAPESAGVALKTIYARMSNIQAGLDDETTLGSYTEKMAQLGINVLDNEGKLRDMGKVVEEIGGKWQTMSREQQVALSQAMAGTRQYNNLLALFDNWDKYIKAIDLSKNATGELQKQQDIYMESTEAHLKKLKATWQDLYSGAIDDKEVHSGIDLLTNFVQTLDNVVDSFGGGLKSLAGLGAILANVFNKQLSQSITNYLVNQDKAIQNIAMLEQKARTIQAGSAITPGLGEAKGNQQAIGAAYLAENETQLKYAKELQEVEKGLTQEQYNQAVQLQVQLGSIEKEAVYMEQIAEQELKKALGDQDAAQYLKDRKNSMEEIAEINNQMLDNAKEELDLQEESYNILKNSFEYYEKEKITRQEIQQIDEEIESIIFKANNSKGKELQALKDEFQGENQIFNFTKLNYIQKQKILTKVKEIVNEQKNEVDGINKKIEAEEKYERARESAENKRMGGSGLAQEFENIIKYGERAMSVSEKVTTVTASLSSLAMAWSSVNSLVQTWSDKNATFGDKILQTMMTLGMVVPSIIKVYKDLAAVEQARQILQKKEIAQEVVRQTLSKVKQGDLKKEISLEEVQVKLKEKGIILSDDAIKKLITETTATKGLGTASAGAAKGVSALGTAVLGLTAAIGIISLIYSKISDFMKEMDEAVKKQKEENDQAIKNAKDNYKLVDSYNDLIDQYKQGKLTIDDVVKSSNDLGDAWKDLDVRTALLTNDYKVLTDALIEYQDKQLEAAKTATESNRILARSQNVKAMNQFGASKAYGGTETMAIGSQFNIPTNMLQLGIASADGMDPQQIEKELKAKEELSKYIKSEWININENIQSLGLVIDFTSTDRNILRLYDDLTKYKKAIDDTNDSEQKSTLIYKQVNDMINSLSKTVEKYKEEVYEEGEVNAQQIARKKEGLNQEYETFKQSREKLLQEQAIFYLNQGILLDDANEQAEKDINKSLDESLDAITKLNMQRLRAEDFFKEKFADDWSEYEKQVQEVLNDLDEDDLTYIVNVDRVESLGNLKKVLEEAKKIAAKYKITAEVKTEFKNKNIDISDKAFETFVENLKSEKVAADMTTKQLKDYNEQTEAVAKYVLIANNALKKINKTWEKDEKILEKGKTKTVGYAKAFTRVKEAMEDVLDMDLTDDFVKKHFKDLGDILKGDTDKIIKLRKEMALFKLGDIDTKDWEQELQKDFNILEKYIKKFNGKKIKINSSLDNTKFITAANSLLAQGKITAEQMNEILAGIGYEAKIEYTEVKVPDFAAAAAGAVGAEKIVKMPQIVSTRYKGTSSYKAPKDTGKSGGGGGGRSKASKQKTEQVKKELDVYHDVNIELKQIEIQLKKIEREKNKLFGKKLIEALNKEISLLNKQVEITSKKIKIAENETSKLKKKLATKGALFNDDGTLANYTELYNKYYERAKKAVDKYNKMSAKQQKKYEKTMKQRKKDFENVASWIEQYDVYISETLPELYENNTEDLDKIVEDQILKFDTSIDIHLDTKEAEREWNEFKKKLTIDEDDILGNAGATLKDLKTYYNDVGTGSIDVLTKSIEITKQELERMQKGGVSTIFGTDMATAKERLEKDLKELMSQLVDWEEKLKEIQQARLDMMDQAADKFDKQIEYYEAISSIIEHDVKLINLRYGDKAYDKLEALYEKEHANNLSQLDFLKKELDFWEAQMEAAGDNEEALEQATEKYKEKLQEFNSLTEATFESALNIYLNTINKTFKALNDELTNGKGLDYVQEEWTLINKSTDQYLDTINKAFETQKIESKYMEALDQTYNISAQRQIKSLMESELKILQNKDKLTKYDIERANKRYELMLKEIALQEAQQNKTKMRLRRDSQGNYRYEYVADTAQVDKLKDEVNDLYNSLYNFDKDQYKNNLDTISNLWTEYQNKMFEAAQINDPTERANREALIRKEYGDLINNLVADNEQIRLNLAESAFEEYSRLYDDNSQEYLAMIEQGAEAVAQKMVPAWTSGIQLMINTIKEKGGLEETYKEAFQKIDAATVKYEQDLANVAEKSSINYEKIISGLDPALEKINKLILGNEELIKIYNTQLEEIKKVENEVDALCKKYQQAKQDAIDAATAANIYLNGTAEEVELPKGSTGSNTTKDLSNETLIAQRASSIITPSINTGLFGNTVNNIKNSIKKVSDIQGDLRTSYLASDVNALQIALKQLGFLEKYPAVLGSFDVETQKALIAFQTAMGVTASGFLDDATKAKFKAKGFDTGGYTGTWNNSGKLAFLHQKELVLNAQDTENMLNAISIMRNITAMIGSANMNRLATAAAGSNSTPLEQNVHIEANFPGVKDAKEIENALNNLVNMASMRANKR